MALGFRARSKQASVVITAVFLCLQFGISLLTPSLRDTRHYFLLIRFANDRVKRPFDRQGSVSLLSPIDLDADGGEPYEGAAIGGGSQVPSTGGVVKNLPSCNDVDSKFYVGQGNVVRSSGNAYVANGIKNGFAQSEWCGHFLRMAWRCLACTRCLSVLSMER